jgi:hypothetical protein
MTFGPGLSIGPSAPEQYGTWKELPTSDVVYGWLKRRAVAAARARMLALDISIEEARITQEKPRDTAVRITGIGGTGPIQGMRRALAEAQAELDDIDADIKMFEFRRDVFKSLSFRERM